MDIRSNVIDNNKKSIFYDLHNYVLIINKN